MSEISKLEQNLIIKKIDKKTVNVSIIDNEMLMAVVGQFDQNLKSLSKLTNTDVYFRGNSITCKGDKEKLSIFCDAIKFLINKYFLTKVIEKEDIVLSVKKNLEIEESNIKSFKQLIKTPKKSVIARSWASRYRKKFFGRISCSNFTNGKKNRESYFIKTGC